MNKKEPHQRFGVTCFSKITLEDRKKIQATLEKYEGKQIVKVAEELKMSRSTLYFERMRMGSLDVPYNAEVADKVCQEKKVVSTHHKIPDSYRQIVVSIYKIIEMALIEKNLNPCRQSLRDCLYLLEKLGANPLKIRKKISIEEKTKIMLLWKEGKSYSEIGKIMNRNGSTISTIIADNINLLDKPEEDIKHEQLTKKWIN